MSQAAAILETTTAKTFRDFAREALRKHDGNTIKAVKYLVNKLIKDKKLLASLIEQIVTEASYTLVNKKHRDNRSAIVISLHDGPASIAALARGIEKCLLDFPLARGVKLRDATAEQVTAQADGYLKVSSDTGHKARWLRLVAQSVPPDKTVGDVMTEKRVQELFVEARKHGTE